MLNWKVLLRSNRFYVVFILLLMLFVFLAFVIPRRSVYEKGLATIEGRVLAYKIDGNFLSLTVKGKEKIQAFYYFQTEEEKLDYLEHLGYGVIVRMEGVLESPESNSLPNTFDYQKYLYYQDIYYVLDVQRLDFVKPSTGLYSFKNFVYRKLYNMKHGDYLVAMILGNTSHLDNQDVRKNGISHLFAISGMQITLLAKVVSFIFQRFGTKRDIGILFMLWIYAFLVGFTPSVMRAVLFWCYQFLNRKMGLQLHKTQIFLWVLGTILLFSPFAIMNLGFQYSFLISFVLMHMKFSKHYLKSSLQISLVSFLVSLPITAINFYSVNVLSILWNLFFVPFVSFGLFPLCFLSIFFPFLEGILGIGITLFEAINHWCASFTFGVIVIPKVSIIWWGVYFVVLGCFLFLHKKQCVFLLVLLLCLIKYPSKLSSHAYVYFLDVGQGDATLFIGPHQKEVILLDTGGKITYSKEHWEERKNQVDQAETIKTFLNSLDISNIDTLILSHGDYDHMGEAINAFDDNRKIAVLDADELERGNYALTNGREFFRSERYGAYVMIVDAGETAKTMNAKLTVNENGTLRPVDYSGDLNGTGVVTAGDGGMLNDILGNTWSYVVTDSQLFMLDVEGNNGDEGYQKAMTSDIVWILKESLGLNDNE